MNFTVRYAEENDYEKIKEIKEIKHSYSCK